MQYLFLVQKDLLLEHFFLTIQKPKVCHVARCMFLKWFSRIFHQKVFNKRIHQMVKNALHKFFRMIFMHSQKLKSNNFDDLTWQKKWNDKQKNWVQPTRKGKCVLVPIGQQLFVFHQQINRRPNQVPSLDFEMYQIFSPKIFFPFPKFVICWLHISERKPFVSKQLFWWRSKNQIENFSDSGKKWFA